MEGDTVSPMTQLETAMRDNSIPVSAGAVQQLLDQREWIYHSDLVKELLERLAKEQLYSVFKSEHLVTTATLLFEFLKGRRCAVVYGHKAVGKTQLLFFVFKLLQAMGEKVLFLDRTVLPAESNKIEIESDGFCGHFWKDSFQLEGPMKTALNKFLEDALPGSFGEFLAALEEYTERTRTRTWVIIDEVVLFKKTGFPIDLPERRNFRAFKWIVTGSADIGSWVFKQHFQKLVFDIPLFTKEESYEFADNLCKSLGIDLADAVDVRFEGISDWLEERFGGIMGYIAEMSLEIAKGKSVSQYMSDFNTRIGEIIVNASGKSITNKELARDWLNEINSEDTNWACLRDAGLCGEEPSRGIVFSFVLKWLFTFSPGEDELSVISHFQSNFSRDPGMEGCLLELEEILKLRDGHSLEASLLKLSDQGWIVEESVYLPPKGTSLNVMMYDEIHSRLDKTPHSGRSSWCLIEIPSGFDVIDAVLVDLSGSSAIYGIQITRSVKPFARLHTLDTCPQRSKDRLERLFGVISDHFELIDPVKLFVMLAPNCEGDEFKATGRHTRDYYFAPARIISEHDPYSLRGRNSRAVPASPPQSKKK